jgi:alanine-synthesizing transaminase
MAIRCQRASPGCGEPSAIWYQTRFGVSLDPDSEAIVTIGSKEGLAHLMLATAGSRVIPFSCPIRAIPIHIYGAVIAGADIRSVRMTPGVDFIQELQRAIRESIPKPKMMILGFPSNPTAQCVELDFFERVVALAKEHEILVVHDLAVCGYLLRWLEGAIDHAGSRVHAMWPWNFSQ